MKIAAVDFTSAATNVKNVQFSSTEMLIDYDIVFIDLNFKINHLDIRRTDRISDINGALLSEKDFKEVESDINRRNQEIEFLLGLGRCVFLCTPPPTSVLAEISGRIDLLTLFTFASFKRCS